LHIISYLKNNFTFLSIISKISILLYAISKPLRGFIFLVPNSKYFRYLTSLPTLKTLSLYSTSILLCKLPLCNAGLSKGAELLFGKFLYFIPCLVYSPDYSYSNLISLPIVKAIFLNNALISLFVGKFILYSFLYFIMIIDKILK